MDQVQVGRFLAELRRQKGLTQEALGERLGVTNKTVSRWERGNYMPDIAMLPLLSELYEVSINELLAGRRMTEREREAQKDDTAAAAFRASIFTQEEQKRYWIRKWRRDHRGLTILLTVIVLGMVVAPPLVHRPWFLGLAVPAALVAYGWRHNGMMAYVERQLYDGAIENATKKAHE